MNLQFDKDTRISGQKLLFHTSTPLRKNRAVKIPNTWALEGYAFYDKVSSKEEAREIIESLLLTNTEDVLENKESIRLAKLDLIPVCHDIVPRVFQALHFDMGQPLWSPTPQTCYTTLALFCPEDTSAGAETRVVSVSRILSAIKKVDDADKRIIEYVKENGDGWTKPTVVNTYRLALFARLLDAISSKNELVSSREETTGQWFSYDTSADGLAREEEFFRSLCIELSDYEKRFSLQKGQLLIVDNIRAAHGRIGARKEKELWQFLYGIPSISPKQIDKIRQWYVNQTNERD